jgi:single-strand DNA-binding protein
MANDLNQCQFIGRLGRDPETRYLPSGEAVTNFSLAVGWKSKDKEGTEWVRCSTFGKLAEIAGQYLTKGKQCYVSGRMSTREWEKEGVKHYSTEIRVDQLQLLGSRDDGEAKPRTHRQMKRGEAPDPDPGNGDGFDRDDDIPF